MGQQQNKDKGKSESTVQKTKSKKKKGKNVTHNHYLILRGLPITSPLPKGAFNKPFILAEKAADKITSLLSNHLLFNATSRKTKARRVTAPPKFAEPTFSAVTSSTVQPDLAMPELVMTSQTKSIAPEPTKDSFTNTPESFAATSLTITPESLAMASSTRSVTPDVFRADSPALTPEPLKATPAKSKTPSPFIETSFVRSKTPESLTVVSPIRSTISEPPAEMPFVRSTTPESFEVSLTRSLTPEPHLASSPVKATPVLKEIVAPPPSTVTSRRLRGQAKSAETPPVGALPRRLRPYLSSPHPLRLLQRQKMGSPITSTAAPEEGNSLFRMYKEKPKIRPGNASGRHFGSIMDVKGYRRSARLRTKK